MAGETPSLRLQKKSRQRATLISVAADRFRQMGYEATRMEDIAEGANVSTKTVYNYFATKQMVLLELLTIDRQKLRAAYEFILADPPENPAEGLARLVRADVGDVKTVADKRLWRELMSAETRNHDRANDEFGQNRKIFTQYIEKLLRRYQAKGALRDDLSVPATVDIVYALNAHNFREYCSTEDMRLSDVLRIVRRQMSVLISGWSADRPTGKAAALPTANAGVPAR
jgi:AcrR family transcriptional regulator